MVFFFVLILLVYLIYRYDILGDNVNRDFWQRCIVFLFIAIAGFRYRIGGDTVNYLEFFYHDTPYLWEISLEDLFDTFFEPLDVLLFSLVYSLGGKFFIVQLIQAAFVNVLLFRFFKKHTQYVFSCFFLYFIWMFIYYDFEELRAGISIVICLLGNDYLLEKKWIKGYLLYVVAIFFHYSSVLLFLTPLFLLLRFNVIGIMILFITIPVSAVFLNMFGDYLLLMDLDSQVSMKASGYINNEDRKGVFNIMSYLVDVGIPVFYSFVSYWYLCVRNVNENLSKLQPFVILAVLFSCVSIHLDIVGRYLHFYAPYLMIYFSALFVELIKNNIELMKSLAIVRSFVFIIPLLCFFVVTLKRVPPRMIDNSCRNYQKYYPYSSIFEKSINDQREKLYRNLYSTEGYHTNIRSNEY